MSDEGWVTPDLLNGWVHSGYNTFQWRWDGDSILLRGQALTVIDRPSDEDLKRPICQFPDETRECWEYPVTKWFIFGGNQPDDRIGTLTIDHEGFLRLTPQERRR